MTCPRGHVNHNFANNLADAHVGYNVVVTKEEKSASTQSIGAQMVARRYAMMTPEERSAAASNAAKARWAGHDAKRPASSRKKAGGKKAGKSKAGKLAAK